MTTTRDRIVISGPFGSYPHRSLGGVLNAAAGTEGVPLTKVEAFQLGSEDATIGRISYDGKRVAQYRWFDDLPQPLFRWIDPDFGIFNQHKLIVEEGGKKRCEFRLTLSAHHTAALEVSGELSTPALHQFLMGMLTNWIDDPRYRLHKDAGAFFQGGHADPNGGWFYIEFWRPEGAQAIIDYVNAHYDPDAREE